MAVETEVDAANRGREAASLALLGELHLGLGHPAEMASETGQLAVRHIAHLLPQTVGTVVQDDLHSPSISPTLRLA